MKDLISAQSFGSDVYWINNLLICSLTYLWNSWGPNPRSCTDQAFSCWVTPHPGFDCFQQGTSMWGPVTRDRRGNHPRNTVLRKPSQSLRYRMGSLWSWRQRLELEAPRGSGLTQALPTSLCSPALLPCALHGWCSCQGLALGLVRDLKIYFPFGWDGALKWFGSRTTLPPNLKTKSSIYFSTFS